MKVLYLYNFSKAVTVVHNFFFKYTFYDFLKEIALLPSFGSF